MASEKRREILQNKSKTSNVSHKGALSMHTNTEGKTRHMPAYSENNKQVKMTFLLTLKTVKVLVIMEAVTN